MSNIQTNVVKPEIKFVSNETEYVVITPFYENGLETKIKAIEDYMLTDGKGKIDEEKDSLYSSAQQLWREYADLMKDAKYNFHLNRAQWKFLTDLLISKLEYDVNTVFFAIELTNLLGSMREVKYTNDTELYAIPVNATEITYIYHLISKHKVKGLTKDAYTFSEILVRIGNISKLFNYYDTVGKNLSTDIQNWVSSFEENVTFDKVSNKKDTVEGKLVEPSN
jgi:uncharacterized protein YjaG (DUF416 family)